MLRAMAEERLATRPDLLPQRVAGGRTSAPSALLECDPNDAAAAVGNQVVEVVAESNAHAGRIFPDVLVAALAEIVLDRSAVRVDDRLDATRSDLP
jgi:hypothetical protein